MRPIRIAVLLWAAFAFAQVPAIASERPYGDFLSAKAERLFRDGQYAAAARLFIEAEQVVGADRERARLAYRAGCSRFKQGLFPEATALFEHVPVHDPSGPSASFAQVAIRECAALGNPLIDFPEGVYIWVQNRWGNEGLSTLDDGLDGWERVRYLVLAVPLLIIAARLLRRVL